MLRALAVAVAVFVCVAAAAQDCTAHCKQWSDAQGAVRFQFTPCSLAVQSLHIEYASGTVVEGSGANSVAECTASGSGTQLSVAVPTARGDAQLVWIYADSDADMVCQVSLRGAGTDAQLTLLGFSVTAPDAPLLSWPGASIHTAHCPALVEADIAVATQDTSVFSAALSYPACYSNAGSRYLLRGTTDTTATLWLEWRFETLWDGAVSGVRLLADNTAVDASQAQLSCAFNLGTALLQIFDAATNRWALAWTYRTYPSCDALISALVGGADDVPAVESAVLIRVSDQLYSWERDSDEQQTTTRLSDRQVACSQPTPSLVPSASQPPVPSVEPMRPVQPFVECVSVGHPGPCVAEFGYYNPNSWAVSLEPHTTANQLLRDHNLQHSALPSVFQPGVHNSTLRVEYACNHRGRPSISWKLRTPVPTELAELLEDESCSHDCRSDLVYSINECSGLFASAPDHDDALNNGDTTDVMRCARTDPRSSRTCVL